MSQSTLNPYSIIGGFYGGIPPVAGPNGLDYIITNIPGTPPSDDDLVNTVFGYINSIGWYGSIPISLQIELKSVVYSVVNSFVNGPIGNYNGTQFRFINMMIGTSFINGLTVDTLKDRILDIEDNITRSGLTVEEQTPLLLATMIGKTANDYLLAQINLGGGSSWNTYFGTSLTSAIANLPFWVAAAMQGALIGATSGCSCKGGMIAPSSEAVSNQMLQALIGALTATAGKIIFKWMPRIGNLVAVGAPEGHIGERIVIKYDGLGGCTIL